MNDSTDASDLASDIEKLQLTQPLEDSGRPVLGNESPNPWEEQTIERPIPKRTLTTPDPNTYEGTVATASALKPPSRDEQEKLNLQEEVLNEFDPLADPSEKEAHDAWARTEGHPASTPTQLSVPVASTSSASAETARPSTPLSFPTLNSITSFARSFSTPKPRPKSVDAAPHILSPSTLSALSSNQQAKPVESDSLQQDRCASTQQREEGDEGDGLKAPPFDFQKFLDQIKSRQAEPVAKYLRSFLSNFSKRTFTVADQIKVINEFLNFISERMRESDIWRNTSEAEFDNAMEAMEKLVMNRLYDFTFTPRIRYLTPPRPVTTDDLERDRVLSQRIALFQWIEPKHLDIDDGDGSRGFLDFAAQELLKVNHYKAPRDKLICILNCCKVIFGLIRHLHTDEGADTFLPILIYVVLRANPPHLISNVEYINRFRNPQKLQSEAGYYLSSLMGAISFVDTIDHSSLSNITPEEFEKNVEDAIQLLPASPESEILQAAAEKVASTNLPPTSAHAGEESAQPLSISIPGQPISLAEDTRRFLQRTGDTISKPLNALGRIFSEALDGADGKRLTYLPGPFAPFEMGRENRQEQASANANASAATSSSAASASARHWADPDEVARFGEGVSATDGILPQTPAGPSDASQTNNTVFQTPYKPRVKQFTTPSSAQSRSSDFSWSPDTPSRGPSQQNLVAVPPHVRRHSRPSSTHTSRTPTPNLDIPGLQAEIDRAHEQAASAALGTLTQIFPSADKEVIQWVLEANEGDLGKSIEAMLEINAEG